jgi:hypothetical protein
VSGRAARQPPTRAGGEGRGGGRGGRLGKKNKETMGGRR